MKKMINIRFGILLLLIILAAMSRLLPHPPNFTPIGAIGLFGAAYFTRKYLAFLIPFAAMWISDLWLNNLVYARMYPDSYEGFAWFGSFWVYAGFALIVALGFLLLKQVKPGSLVLAGFSSSLLFFLITNFGVWLGSIQYPPTFEGLMACYLAGIPFFWNTLLGDLFYVTLLFGSYEFIRGRAKAWLAG